MILTGELEHWWNDTDRGNWSIGGMILTGELEHWWNDTDRGIGALVE